jgi:hypothetical protein
LLNQVFSGSVIGQTELLPPIGQGEFNFTHFSAKTKEIKTSPEASLLNQAERGAANAFFKTWLHHPNFTHVSS